MAAKNKEARASVKFVRVAPNKVRIVLDQIRGLHVQEARRVLQFSSKSVSHEVGKLLEAVIANAENVLSAQPDVLYLSKCWADEGMTMKRWMPRAQGRAYKIRKRTSHITLVVEARDA
jgi:large subunit ribosomal protein L22